MRNEGMHERTERPAQAVRAVRLRRKLGAATSLRFGCHSPQPGQFLLRGRPSTLNARRSQAEPARSSTQTDMAAESTRGQGSPHSVTICARFGAGVASLSG